eukprot:6026000-Prymnesium_polylepis.1
MPATMSLDVSWTLQLLELCSSCRSIRRRWWGWRWLPNAAGTRAPRLKVKLNAAYDQWRARSCPRIAAFVEDDAFDAFHHWAEKAGEQMDARPSGRA